MTSQTGDVASVRLAGSRLGSRGLWSWLLQRLSGLLLVYFVGLHIVTLHFLRADPINAGGIARRLQESPFLIGFYSAFVVVVILHAANGVRGMALDYATSRHAVRVIDYVAVISIILATAYALLVLSALVNLP